MKGFRARNVITNSHKGVKYDMENIINNIVITLSGARWVPDFIRLVSL